MSLLTTIWTPVIMRIVMRRWLQYTILPPPTNMHSFRHSFKHPQQRETWTKHDVTLVVMCLCHKKSCNSTFHKLRRLQFVIPFSQLPVKLLTNIKSSQMGTSIAPFGKFSLSNPLSTAVKPLVYPFLIMASTEPQKLLFRGVLGVPQCASLVRVCNYYPI